MPLRQLSLNNFRNLNSTTLEFDSHFNLFYGMNGSGKTSFLESIHIVCEGQSFRTRQLDHCIQHDQVALLLFAKFSDHQVGFSKSANNRNIHIDGEPTNKRADLVRLAPIRVINSDSMALVTGKPSCKREFLDWCLFHVEHKYPQLWQQHAHALKQKNALLKNKINDQQLDYWNDYLIQYNESISAYRANYLQKITQIIYTSLNDIYDSDNLSLEYECGWDNKKSLADIYRNNRQRELKYGYSLYGIQRDNIHIRYKNSLVQETLSSGQLKKLAIALYIAQIILVNESTAKPVVILIDDLTAELDAETVLTILQTLKKLQAQIFLTVIDLPDYLLAQDQEVKLFHVEHGIIRTVKNT